ncbi:MAG: glycosyltransferase [Weeksellaceae bacterium]
MRKNILFITWDGPQTSYAEGLFMPIFHEIEKINPNYKFHYLQFTWADNTQSQQQASMDYNIPYASAPISRKPIPVIGSIISLFQGKKQIKQAIKMWNIDILMPRSNFPAFMVGKLNTNLPVIFDADGLPIEERIDFAGLKRGGFMHKFLKSIEKKAIQNSDHIITRSQKSIKYHLQQYNPTDKDKFTVVSNGRDVKSFKPKNILREEKRNELGIENNTTVFIYAGSFGPQYGWDIMLNTFQAYLKINSNAHFLFLTGSPEKVSPLVPKDINHKFTIKKVPFSQVANYLNVADIAFAIREPKFSMQGVAPIKLGEYLLMGIPTIASDGIGDTKEIIQNIPGTLLYNHQMPPTEEEILAFINLTKNISKNTIRDKALSIFSLEASATTYIKALKKLNS